MNRDLRAFIKDALERGHNREEIRSVLVEAGWQPGEVNNGLAGFADVNFPVAVPKPAPDLYAREAFLYLVSFIALYVSAISFVLLVFGLIDFSFPDALDYGDGYPSGGEASGIAAVIVAFPLYLFLTRWLARQVAADPERRQSLVRRWLTYLTLVVGAGIILGDLIALLANVLMGDPTLRFALKAVSILVITGCAFGYYAWDMRQAEATAAARGNKWAVRVLVVAVVIVVVGCIAYALSLVGSPGQQRDIRLDDRRVSDLINISNNVDMYWELNEELPENFAQMSAPRYDIYRVRDPETRLPYEYRALEGAQYELCAMFSTDTAEPPHGDRPFFEGTWDHGEGRTCFQLEAQTAKAPEK
jgi:hypothetical protein